jgi:hypothetical protein
MKRKLSSAAVVILVGHLCCGCVTRTLWEDKAFNEPSPQPNLQLYYSEQKRDVFVVYDELREPSSSVCRRGYFLKERRAENQRPLFVDPRGTKQLRQIPIVTQTNAPAANAFAVLHDPAKFSLTINGEQKGPYELPVYPSGFHHSAQIALTPLAVTADTVIVGSVVGGLVVYWWASSKTSGYNPSY